MFVVENSVDTFHSWDADNPHWTETFWYGAWVPEQAMSIYIYQWFRPVLGIYGGGCFVWDARHHLPWDLPAFYYDVNLPITGPVDLRALELGCGTRLRSVVEGRRYETSFRRDDIEVEMNFDAVTPAEIVTAKGMTEFFSGHIDQAGRYTGRVRLGADEHRIDCVGIRDRSWGPRAITNDIRMNYCHGQSAETAFVAYSKPKASADEVFKGYLSLGGERLDLAHGTRHSRYESGRLLHIEIEIEDTRGRTLRGRGRPVNTMVYMPYPNLLTWLYLVRWEVGSQVVYGEEQDVWSLPLWRSRDRRLRGA